MLKFKFFINFFFSFYIVLTINCSDNSGQNNLSTSRTGLKEDSLIVALSGNNKILIKKKDGLISDSSFNTTIFEIQNLKDKNKKYSFSPLIDCDDFYQISIKNEKIVISNITKIFSLIDLDEQILYEHIIYFKDDSLVIENFLNVPDIKISTAKIDSLKKIYFDCPNLKSEFNDEREWATPEYIIEVFLYYLHGNKDCKKILLNLTDKYKTDGWLGELHGGVVTFINFIDAN